MLSVTFRSEDGPGHCIWCDTESHDDCGDCELVNTQSFTFVQADIVEQCPDFTHVKWQQSYTVTEGSGIIWVQLNLETNTWSWGGSGIVLQMSGSGRCCDECQPGTGTWPICNTGDIPVCCGCLNPIPNPCTGQTPPTIDSCEYHEENICCPFDAGSMKKKAVINASGSAAK